MQGAKSTRLFLIFALLLVNINSYQASPLLECDSENSWNEDSQYEERRQELADEIDDVNDYMMMVADQLTNDGVVVVRAIRTRITSPDIGDEIKPDILSLGDGDSSENSESVEIVSTDETADFESKNLLSSKTELVSATEIQKSYFDENEILEGKVST